MSRKTGTCAKCEGPLDGKHQSYCKPCMAAYAREHRAKNPQIYRDASFRMYLKDPKKANAATRKSRLKKSYGLTPDDFDRMLSEQGHQCVICSREIKRLQNNTSANACVDHDHKTGEVRGLLCGNCNKAIGLMADNPNTLIAAAAYLIRQERFSWQPR